MWLPHLCSFLRVGRGEGWTLKVERIDTMSRSQQEIYTDMVLTGKSDEELAQMQENVTNACNDPNSQTLRDYNNRILQYIQSQTRRSTEEEAQ